MQGLSCTGKSCATDVDVMQMRDMKITGIICGNVRYWDGECGAPDQEAHFTRVLPSWIFVWLLSVSLHVLHIFSKEKTFSIEECIFSCKTTWKIVVPFPIGETSEIHLNSELRALWMYALWDWNSPCHAVRNEDPLSGIGSSWPGPSDNSLPLHFSWEQEFWGNKDFFWSGVRTALQTGQMRIFSLHDKPNEYFFFL